ncbi:MAG TPA: DoxX family protein [Candidatus Sulfotelmatobacter sp.]|nr:DoxX family protein [Candidatus Sulfotelmatobacter sp.]
MPNSMQGAEQTAANSKAGLWAGRAISSILVLFLVFDGTMKVIKEAHVMAANAEIGYPPNSIPWIGALLLVCTVVYVIPRLSILGAILLTAYLGGAVATQVRVAHPVFDCLFPVVFGMLIWAGIFLRDAQLRQMIPVRRSRP